ncbi:electron transfer flavoprotein subunit beta/FixA family protein [Cupriavidus sp. 8B]
MKVLVAVKRVVDFNVNIRIKSDLSGVETANVKMSINPFDEVAVEQAVRLKEQDVATEVVAVSVGPEKAQETLRTALAMGADRAILVQTDVTTEPLGVAKALKALIAREEPALILLGKQAIDDDCNQTGQMLAGLLGWPQATSASSLTLDGTRMTAAREVDAGIQRIEVGLPAVVTVDLRLNDPRHASLPNIMKSKKKPLDILTPEALGIDVSPRTVTMEVRSPTERTAGKKAASLDELAHEIQVIMEGQ